MFKLRVLKEEEIKNILDIENVIEAVEKAYKLKAKNEAALFPMIFHEFEEGVADMDIKAGHLLGANIYGFKQVSWFGNNTEKNLPQLIGNIMVYDGSTGAPIGLLSASHITSMRTGAAGGIGSKYLARKSSEDLLVIGSGNQAFFQIAATLTTMDNIKRVKIYNSRSYDNALNLVKAIKDKLKKEILSRYIDDKDTYERLLQKFDVDFEAVKDIQKATEEADIIITTTPSKKPLLKDEWIKPGTHINCVGADMEGKQEIDEKIFGRARVYVDDIKQATNVGETETPIKKGVISKDDILGEIGNLILGEISGRLSDDDITIYDTTGLALQDLITADYVLRVAKEKNLGAEVEI